MLLKEDIVDIEKPDGIFWLTFVADEFSILFLNQSIVSIVSDPFFNVIQFFYLSFTNGSIKNHRNT